MATAWAAVVVAATERQPQRGPRRGDKAGAIIAAALALPGVVAHAQAAPEHGILALKYLDYRDSQPGLDRIKVSSPSIYVLAPLSPQWAIEASLVSDSVSGATPRYHTAISGATPHMSDHRYAGNVQVTRYFDRSSYSLGVAGSNENDYRSGAVSLNAAFSSDDNNQTWNVGLGYASDKITSVNDDTLHERRRTAELLLGLTQVWTANDVVQLNLSLSRGRGFYSDPYKEPDVRPRERDQAIALVRWNHYVAESGAAVRSAYRLYHDSYGINAQTLSAEWVQPFGGRFTVTPSLRLYSQSAARFYFDPLYDPDLGPPYPPGYFTNPPQHISPDQRLSAFGGITAGLEFTIQITPDWLLDLKGERYEQRSGWRIGGNGSPGLAPFRATFLRIGVETRF